MIKANCLNCIHIKVCSIYAFAVKNNEESIVKIKPNSMYSVCNNYLQNIIIKDVRKNK